MAKYILYYFPVNGRALIPGVLLLYGKVDWTNHLINPEEWLSIKKSGLCEYEQVIRNLRQKIFPKPCN